MKKLQKSLGLTAVALSGLLALGSTPARADGIRPTVDILTPTNGITTSIDTINVQATDNVSVSRVDVLIYRRDDGLFFNGTNFGGTPTYLATTRGVGGDNNVFGANQVPGALEGRLIIYAFAYDNDGTSGVDRTFVDNNLQAPAVLIQTPFNVTSINGTAGDGPTGSGIRDVRLLIQRPDSQYWNGTNFQPTPFYLTTTMNPPGGGESVTWARSGGLPGFTDITQEGRYTVTAVAFDRAGRAGRDVRSGLLVRSTPTTQFSNGAAFASTQTVTLTFTGPLDPTSVTPQTFGVAVGFNGTFVPVTNATYDAATNTVTLTVAPNSFTAFTPVAAGWQNLRDAEGRPFTDFSGVLIAQP